MISTHVGFDLGRLAWAGVDGRLTGAVLVFLLVLFVGVVYHSVVNSIANEDDYASQPNSILVEVKGSL